MGISHRSSSLIRLLQAAALNRTDLNLDEFPESQIRWAVESGLGPLLSRCAGSRPGAKTSSLWPLIRGADLTARMIKAEQMDAMEEIIRACESAVEPLTLLKGISIGDEFYPEPHLRPMKDIDFLVDRDAVPFVESALFQLGYHQRSRIPVECWETEHQTAPFYNRQTHVWVEVHKRLVHTGSPWCTDKVLDMDNVRAERHASEFRGRPINRLSAELQIVYLASHWAREFQRLGSMVGMLDMVYLLKRTTSVRWNRVLDWLDGAAAAGPVYLLLSYLARHRLVDLPPGTLGELARRQRSFGKGSLALVHALIDRHVTNGREFDLLVSERNFERLWLTFLWPRPPAQRLPAVLWNLLPSRIGLVRRLAGYIPKRLTKPRADGAK